jgi:gamma-glutamylcyclotransferase
VPFYFAYGSNLCKRQVLTGMDGKPARCPGAKPIGKALLTGWRYLIYARGYANIVPDGAGEVWGGVWEVTEEHISSLDKYEGRVKNTKKCVYHREEVEVELDDGASVKCLVYVDSNERGDIPGVPQEWYQARILEGAHDFALPPAYIVFLGEFGK